MNAEVIRRLLEKYYNAETSVEEELELRKFFSSGDVPEDLFEERAIFTGFEELSELKGPSEDLDKKIIASIFNEGGEIKALRNRRIYSVISGIAAGLLILTATWFFLSREEEPRDTFSDPEIAYAETMKILYKVSAKLNSGMEGLEPVGKMKEVTGKSLENLNLPGEIVEEKLKPLDRIRKVMETVNNLETK